MEKLKVIIIGAGMGGLTAGIALERAGFTVEIYERVKEMRPVGAGISLWSNGVKILNSLGLSQEIAAIGGKMERMEYRSQTGELLNSIELYPLIEAVGQRPYPVARADLQKMLWSAIKGEIKLNHSCTAIEEDEAGVTAIFENGQQVRGDVLIAADGIRSILRSYVVEEEITPQYAGYINWNGLVKQNEELAPKDTWMIYVGDHQRASMMPVGFDRFYFFFDVPLAQGRVNQPDKYQAELKEYFQGWAQPVQKMIDSLDPGTVARLEIHDLSPLNRLVKGRVALLGDAAHATCPDLGQGGCQAMEDGLVLAHYLQTTNIGVEDALKRYETERKGRVHAVVKKARQRAEQIHGKEPEVTQKWYKQLSQESPTDVTDAIAKLILAGPMR